VGIDDDLPRWLPGIILELDVEAEGADSNRR